MLSDIGALQRDVCFTDIRQRERRVCFGPARRNRHVRFGSKADMCSAIGVSALPPKADIKNR
jgi:hypothetical protein